MLLFMVVEISTKGRRRDRWVRSPMSNSMNTTSAVKSAPVRSLILKHEILSPECDLFRVCLPRRVFIRRMGRLMGFVAAVGVGYWWMEAGKVAVISGLMLLVTLLILLSQVIEERILFIRGLGVQYTVLNGFHQETTNFYPFEQIKSYYIFESFDGLKVGHFFCIKLGRGLEGSSDIGSSSHSKSVVLFENMRPPVEFLKRVYSKFSEITA